jgi:hypothetical protein
MSINKAALGAKRYRAVLAAGDGMDFKGAVQVSYNVNAFKREPILASESQLI